MAAATPIPACKYVVETVGEIPESCQETVTEVINILETKRQHFEKELQDTLHCDLMMCVKARTGKPVMVVPIVFSKLSRERRRASIEINDLLTFNREIVGIVYRLHRLLTEPCTQCEMCGVNFHYIT